jgi:hypothetical protein
MYSTDSRKNFTSIESFITEPNSRAQSIALEENVKEFGLTYFGITDRRQGKQDSLAPIYPALAQLPFQVSYISSVPNRALRYATITPSFGLRLYFYQLPGITCVCGDSHTSSKPNTLSAKRPIF